VRARRLLQSAWFQSNWGHIFQFADDQNQKQRMENNRSGHRIAVGTGGSATGEGGSHLLLDDPHSLENVGSDVVRKGTLDWFDQVWSTRRNDPKTSARVIIMQRSHCDDLAGHVLEQGGWEHLSLPAEYEGAKSTTVIGWSDPRTTEGELLWPERFGPPQIAEAKKTLGSFAYAGQFQQRPVPASGGIWKKDWFRFYRRSDLPETFDMLVASWDCTFKDAKTSDFVAGQLWGRKGANFYLLEQVHARMDFPATLAAIRNLNTRTKHTVNGVLIEDKANGSAIVSTLKQEIPGVLPINPQGGKESRAAAVAPLIEAGNVLLPMLEEQPWIGDTLLEFVMFPAAKNDDRCDAMSQALLWLQAKKSAFDPEFMRNVIRANAELEAPSYWHQLR
jgi:predicted phage terminase large subunit-like protein